MIKHYKKLRHIFAKMYGHFTIEAWEDVIFSNQSKMNGLRSNGCPFTWRSAEVKLAPHIAKETLKFGGDNVII